MRKVFGSASEVVHRWANKTQQEGRNGSGNCSFNGNALYSYSTIVGMHLPNGAVALCNYGYSSTTDRQIWEARKACKHLTVIRVPKPYNILESLKYSQKRIDSLLKAASTARSKRDSYLAEAKGYVDSFNAFAEALGVPDRMGFDATPEMLASIAKEKAAAAKRDREAAAARVAQQAEERAKELAKWLAGEHYLNTYLLRDAPVALRIFRQEIQTSHGASIPLKDASRIWKMVTKTMAGDRDFQPGEPIGAYRLTKIRKDGSMIVGCHDIPFTAIESIAKQLGYI